MESISVRTILIADDEAEDRFRIRRILEAEGYRVLEAADGKASLAILGEPGSAVDLLISDIIMPQMNGRDLAKRARSLNPFLKVLFISGYSAGILAQLGLCTEDAELIRKPVDARLLLGRIRDVIDRKAEDGAETGSAPR